MDDFAERVRTIGKACLELAPQLYGPAHHLAKQVALLAEELSQMARVQEDAWNHDAWSPRETEDKNAQSGSTLTSLSHPVGENTTTV